MIICEDDNGVVDILKRAKTIVLYALSPDENKPSNKVAKYLISAGYKVVPIYPKYDEILGQKVYRKISDVPFAIDILDVFRASSALDGIVDEAIKAKVSCIWSQLDIVDNDAMKKALLANIRVVQDKCTKIEHQKFLG